MLPNYVLTVVPVVNLLFGLEVNSASVMRQFIVCDSKFFHEVGNHIIIYSSIVSLNEPL